MQVGAVKERIAIWQVTLRGSESVCVDAGWSGEGAGWSGEGEDRHMAGDAPWL